jgi:hypothetical protein
MLGSITPLGERARGRSWGVTAATFVAASTAAGISLGAALGSLGGFLDLDVRPRALALGGVASLGVALDLAARLPTPARQVNQDWIGRYRGWVVGVGFGAQLGVGVATIVTTSAVYAALGAAALAGGSLGGALVGGTFGLVRGAAILPAAGVTGPEALARIDRWLGARDRLARRIAIGMQGAVAAAVLAGAVR